MVTGYQTQTASNDRHFYYCRHPFNTTNNQSNSCGKITANILSDVYWRIFPGTWCSRLYRLYWVDTGNNDFTYDSWSLMQRKCVINQPASRLATANRSCVTISNSIAVCHTVGRMYWSQINFGRRRPRLLEMETWLTLKTRPSPHVLSCRIWRFKWALVYGQTTWVADHRNTSLPICVTMSNLVVPDQIIQE